jgi:pantoate--beta-alanine ligase
MRRAREENGQAIVSLFVNPLQFGPSEDFAKYPRREEEDFEMARSVGVDAVFAPSVDEMYGVFDSTIVKVSEVTERWEGQHRPGHFEGVSTVVLKLFNIVGPDRAYFGQKDLQQCATVKQMVQDLKLPIEVKVEPTVRESDGLALSSRNRYLSETERKVAPKIIESLLLLKDSILRGAEPERAIGEASANLTAAGFDIDYLAYVDTITLEPLVKMYSPSSLIFAAKLGKTRLIDNVSVS